MGTISEILMKRNGLTKKEADHEIDIAQKDFRERLRRGEMPFDICEELFGLEPDYLDELIGFV